jgi:hypothetical protein
LEISFTLNTDAFKRSIDDAAEKYEAAFSTAKNMIQSMMITEVLTDLQNAGNFGKISDSLSVTVDGNTITTEIDAPGAMIFETGGTIHGSPLLWLPISGTDAEGVQASNYGDQLFSVNRKAGGVPLLFSIKDRAPKYFGVPSVTIPKKFHIGEIQERVMSNFTDIVEDALK